jgi:hypothetical protein
MDDSLVLLLSSPETLIGLAIGLAAVVDLRLIHG